VTATGSSAGGYVTVWPEGVVPNVSSLNVSGANESIPNHVIMATGSDGSVRLYTSTDAQLLIDITGWYL
jgi:hypothetical protein